MSRNIRLALALTYILSLVGFTLLMVVGATTSRQVELVVQDPAVATGGLPWFGLLSNVGVLLWCAAATVCLFTAVMLQQCSSPSSMRRFFAAAGLLSLMLLIDDLFMIHEWLLPNYGIPEMVAYVVYGSVMLVFLVQFRQQLRNNYPRLFLAMLGFFSGSILIDGFFDATDSAQTLESGYSRSMLVLEDGLKFLGIVSWLNYFGLVSNRALRRLSAPHRLPVTETGIVPIADLVPRRSRSHN